MQMPENDYNDSALQIGRELKKLNYDQHAFFAWICGVRSLPFLGAAGTIGVWKKKHTKKYLYSVLYALDMAADYSYGVGGGYEPVYAAAVNAARAADAADAVNAAVIAAIAVVNAAKYAVEAAYAAHDFDFNSAANNGAADEAASATSRAAANAAKAANMYDIDLSSILLEDIECIKSNTYSAIHKDKRLYGQVWDCFQDALRKIGCAYWGELYANIFESGFKLDKEALTRRMRIPAEIREQGAMAVANYLLQLESQGSERFNEARVLILGEKGAGKTCLARRLIDSNAPMTAIEESTEGVETSIWKITDKSDMSTVNAHIWDFAGHVITHAAHRCFLSERCLYIIVYDGRSEERNRLNYWLDHVRNYGKDAPVRVLVNLYDEHKPDIPINTLKKKYPFIIDFSFLSIDKDKEGLQKFNEKTTEFILNNPLWNCLEIPTNYYDVKEDLEGWFQRNEEGFINEHIKREVFDRIAIDNRVERDSIECLLKDLHELGICLWYKDLAEFNTLVLNPDWITHGIYKLINWAHNNSKHTIALADYERIFQDEILRYPKDKLSFIFKLMKKYELAYSKETDDIINVPFLLREDQPEKLPHFSINDSLMLQYVADQPLPPNTVSRLIVRYNGEIRSEHEVWQYGVVLKYKEETIALVEEEDRKISVSVKGKDKSSYIAMIRDTLNDIFNSYQCEKPELQYKIMMSEPFEIKSYDRVINNDAAIMLSDETIHDHIINGRAFYYAKANKEIPLELTAREYKIVNYGSIIVDSGNNSPINTFNFFNCNLAMQVDLNSLLSPLKKAGHEEIAAYVEDAVNDLEKAKNMETKEDIIKSGCLAKAKNFLEDLGDEKSSMHKVINGVKYGAKTAQSVAKTYNDIAQWIGLPQVPKPFLGKD